jgi:hypothetical protein
LVALDHEHNDHPLEQARDRSLAPSVLDARYHMESLEEMHRCAVPGTHTTAAE